jgi:CcmD family protein
MDSIWYLALAYAVIWVGLFAYLVNLAREGRSIRQQMDLLRDLVDGSGMASEMELPEAETWEQEPQPTTAAGRLGDGWPALER